MGVKIIIDSASDMTRAEAEQEGLIFLPLKTIFGEEEYLDGVTISHQEFYEKLKSSPVTPTTSQVAPAEFEEAYREAVQDGSKAVVITISEKLSGTYQSAMIAREGYEDHVFVVDSENGSLGEQILVRLAIRMREQGMTEKYIRDSEYLWKDHTDKLPIGTLGSTIGTHAGPGAVVVAFFHK